MKHNITVEIKEVHTYEVEADTEDEARAIISRKKGYLCWPHVNEVEMPSYEKKLFSEKEMAERNSTITLRLAELAKAIGLTIENQNLAKRIDSLLEIVNRQEKSLEDISRILNSMKNENGKFSVPSQEYV